jgi:hypothetical protein
LGLLSQRHDPTRPALYRFIDQAVVNGGKLLTRQRHPYFT